MFSRILSLAFLIGMLVGCGSTVQNVKTVKTYKSVNQFSTLELVKGNQNKIVPNEFLDQLEDDLFKKLYSEENSENFIPGDQLKLKYEILNTLKMKKHLTDFGTYFGKDNSQFEVLFTILDNNNKEIGYYHINIDVEYWLFPTQKMVNESAIDAASYAIARHLKANYLQ